MAKLDVQAGSVSVLDEIYIQDATSPSGAGLTGLTSASSGLTCYVGRADDGNAGGTAISLTSTGTLGTWASGWFKEKDATNMPGVYEFGYTNASLATGSRFATFTFKGATNMAEYTFQVQLTGTNNQDAVRGGMTALPNANAAASGGLPVIGTGANNFKSNSSANVTADVTSINGVSASSVTTINANMGTTQPVNFTGTGASALAKSDVVDIAGSAVSASSAQIGVNVVNVKGSASVGAAGYVGIDWGNINAPTTANNLSGTTVATVINQLTAAQIATGVWQDTTAGDFIVASSIGKSLFTGNHAPGAASGLALVASQMDFVNAPNATAIAAIQSGLATPTNITAGTITTVTNLANLPSIPANWITSAGIATDAIGSNALATSAVQEIRNAITGGAYALNTDANGSVRIVDGTGVGEIDTLNGAIATVLSLTNAPSDSSGVTTLLSRVTAAVALHSDITALNNLSTSQVLAQMETALNVTTRTMPGQAAPSATPTVTAALMQLYKQATSPTDQTTTEQSILNWAGTQVDQKRSVADDGNTFSLGALIGGP